MFTIDSATLQAKLKLLGMGISKENTIKQSTRMIRLQSHNGILYGVTFNGENNIQVELGSTTDKIFAIVEYNLFNNFIKECDGDITFDFKENYLNLKTESIKGKVPTYNRTPQNCGIPVPEKKQYLNSLSLDINFSLLKLFANPDHSVSAYRYVFFGKNNVVATDMNNAVMFTEETFDNEILLSLNSIELLLSLTNCKYDIEGSKLFIKSDEICGTIQIHNENFQSADLIQLFMSVVGESVNIDVSNFNKAVNTAKLFNQDPDLVFNSNGVFIENQAAGFVYSISNVPCKTETRVKLTPQVTKYITTLDKEITIYYTNPEFLYCKSGLTSEIFSVV